MIPILGCGEEAAALAFDGLARASKGRPFLSATLQLIAAEERVHDGLMHGLADALPHISAEAAQRAARRLHIRLGTGGAELHLAKIAALDAAVCTVLSRLLRTGLPIAQDTLASRTLGRIRRDEARHVALSRSLVLDSGVTGRLREVAAETRVALAGVLMIEADAFEVLQVDPAKLERDVSRLPDGLFAA